MTRHFSPAGCRRKKKMQPSLIPSKTPPFRETGKGGAAVVEAEN
jgi:hypothetical protein